MKGYLVALAVAGTFLSAVAGAQTFGNGSLQNVNGTFGSVNVATTTTTATGTRTSVTGTDFTGNGRASGTATVNSWVQSNIGNGSTVGITTDYSRGGNGSAYFNSTLGASGKGDLINYFGTNGSVAPVLLSTLTNASFDFYRDSASTTSAQLAPVLRLDILKDGKGAGSLVFENIYQNQTNPATDTWVNLSSTLTSGTWWATNSALGPTFAAAAGGQKSLQDWINGNSGSTLSVYGVEIGIGSGWNGTFFGAVDNVNVAFSGGRTVAANFEVTNAAAVPEPASWGMMILGAGGIGAVLRRRRTRSTAALA